MLHRGHVIVISNIFAAHTFILQPPLKKSALKEITPECVLKCLPGIAKSRSSEGQKVIQALVKAYNYKVYMLNTQVEFYTVKQIL